MILQGQGKEVSSTALATDKMLRKYVCRVRYGTGNMKKCGQNWKSTGYCCAGSIKYYEQVQQSIQVEKNRIIEKSRRIKYKIITVKKREWKIFFMEKKRRISLYKRESNEC